MKWVALFSFGLIGLLIMTVGTVWGVRRYLLVRDGVRALGKVAVQAEGQEGSGGALVEFETDSGQRVRFEPNTDGKAKALVEAGAGAEVQVVYDRKNPSNALVLSSDSYWLSPLLLAGFGLVFFIMGTASFFLIRQNDRAFGPEFYAMMARDRLVFRADTIKIEGEIRDVRRRENDSGGGWVFVCTGLRPGRSFDEEFESELFTEEPNRSVIGRRVTIVLDPEDESLYLVELGPLLREATRHLER